jgi:hypothetical protein
MKPPKSPAKVIEQLPVGLHRVVVKKMDFLRNMKNQIIYDKEQQNVPRALKVTYEDPWQRQIEDIFWFSEAAQWKINAFAKAIQCNLGNGENKTSAIEIINIKHLYIVVAAQTYVDFNGELIMGRNNFPLHDPVLLPKYYYDSSVVPALNGDPLVPSGIYLLEPKLITEKDV